MIHNISYHFLFREKEVYEGDCQEDLVLGTRVSL